MYPGLCDHVHLLWQFTILAIANYTWKIHNRNKQRLSVTWSNTVNMLLPEVQCLDRWTPQSVEKFHWAQRWQRLCTWSAGEDRMRTWHRLTAGVPGCKPQSCDQAKRLACTSSRRYTCKHCMHMHNIQQLIATHARRENGQMTKMMMWTTYKHALLFLYRLILCELLHIGADSPECNIWVNDALVVQSTVLRQWKISTTENHTLASYFHHAVLIPTTLMAMRDRRLSLSGMLVIPNQLCISILTRLNFVRCT